MLNSHPDQDPEDRMPDSHLPRVVGKSHSPAFKQALQLWHQKPISRPVLPADLEQLSWPERSAEVVRHALLSMEYWLSQGGWLREWIRLNLWTGAVLFVLALIVVPPVTAILGGIRDWTRLLSDTIGNINVAVATLPPIVLALATALMAVKLIQRYRAKHRPHRRQEYNPYE